MLKRVVVLQPVQNRAYHTDQVHTEFVEGTIPLPVPVGV